MSYILIKVFGLDVGWRTGIRVKRRRKKNPVDTDGGSKRWCFNKKDNIVEEERS